MQTKFVAFGILILSFTGISSFASNFYLGAGLGPDLATFSRCSFIDRPGTFTALDETHLSGTGIFAAIDAGYNWVIQNYSIGAEINANLSTMESASKNEEYLYSSFARTRFKMNSAVGISLLPGVIVASSTQYYAVVGYSLANFSIVTNDRSLVNINRYLSGLRTGFGIRQALIKQLSLKMEYTHVGYQTNDIFAVDGATTKLTHILPVSNQVEIGLQYNFI